MPDRHGCADEEQAEAAHDGELQKRHRGQAHQPTFDRVSRGLAPAVIPGAETREQAEAGTLPRPPSRGVANA
jgi:hypothetical protein